MEIRDPIHGLIKYDEKEEKLINSSIFQRLRGIKQLALANLVYPGAHHTRFEHCIGTMHLAGRIAKQLKLSTERIKILRLAGLLHDIGHGPFSHVSEQIMETCTDKKIVDRYKAKMHMN
jgi:HD superfamily phosphohydrolase